MLLGTSWENQGNLGGREGFSIGNLEKEVMG